MALVIPSFVSAATVEELQAMINSLQQQIQQLQSQLSQLQSGGGMATSTIPCVFFNTNLKLGSTGTDVSSLQTTLEAEGFGISQQEQNQKSFGQSTASAVNNFQEKYKGEILTPLGLNNGTGFVGAATRTKLNKLYRCGGTITSSCITDIMCVEKYESHDSGRKYSNGCPILECIPVSTSSCVPEGGSLSASVSTAASQLKCCSGLIPSISTGGGKCVKPLTITTTSLPNGTAGTSYLAGITGSGGSGGYSWSATGVPSGLVFSTGQCTPVLGSTCLPPAQISGIPTFAGTYTITITLKTSNNETTSKSFTLTVTGQNQTCTNKWWFDSNTTTCSYKQFCGEYMYQGLQTFDTETACKAALPTSTDTQVTIKASLPSGTVGSIYSGGFTATNYDTTKSYEWFISGLPSGLAIFYGQCTATIGHYCLPPVTISGTPTTAGTYTIAVAVKLNGILLNKLSLFYLTIVDATPVIVTTSLPNGMVGTSYSANITASPSSGIGGSFSATGLPPGLIFYPGECMSAGGTPKICPASISGTPTTTGTYNVVITLTYTDSRGNNYKISTTLPLVVFATAWIPVPIY